jgi:hypothetical protein
MSHSKSLRRAYTALFLAAWLPELVVVAFAGTASELVHADIHEKANGGDLETFGELHAAAERGDARVQYQLGLAYLGGRSNASPCPAYIDTDRSAPVTASCIAPDHAKAAFWFRKAAEQSYARAQFALAQLYVKGDGLQQNYTRAAYWYLQAARQGNTDAMVKLGDLYAKGQGVKQNAAQAASLYLQAARHGNADGQENLGRMLETGQGVAKNEAQAAVLFILAKAGGNARAAQSLVELKTLISPAQFAWAQRHAETWKIVDLVRRASHGDLAAVRALRKEAAKGVAGAQVALGALYNSGEPMQTDFSKAAAWYHKAAEQGNANAYYNLGELYMKGQGVRKNHVKALKWLMLSAAEGNYQASAQAAALKWKMTPEEIEEAKHRANRWQAEHSMH